MTRDETAATDVVGLVDDDKMLVFESDDERNVLRFVMSRLRIGDCDDIRLASLHLGCGIPHRRFTARDAARRYESLQPFP